MLTRTPDTTYEQLRRDFRWHVPERINIGRACSDDQTSDALAIVEVGATGAVREFTFGELSTLSDRFANGLRGLGITPGDRVGLVMPQRIETVIAHLAIYKIGCVAVPMSRLFGPEALGYRLADCGARAVLADPDVLERVVEATDDLEDVTIILAADTARAPHHAFWDVVANGSERLEMADTRPDTPALLIYTSGTTGPPKGALHGHRTLIGHTVGFELMYDFYGQADDRAWTPADWAWIGGLMDALIPSLFLGRPVVGADRAGFDPDWAVDLMVAHGVRAAFIPPTALKLMRRADAGHPDLALRTVMSGGEPLGEEILDWGRDALGVTVNEIYGQTESNLVVGNCQSLWPVRPGSMGRPYPGHDIAVLDVEGQPVADGEVGNIAVRAPDPVMFLQYWNRPEATADKFIGDWMLTGDLGHRDDDGYLWFTARNDDVISSAGYRIGPGEIEDCLLGHEAVAMSAVIGVPDDTRGHVVKAYVLLTDDATPSDDLARDIQQHVRTRLSSHEYPRLVEFVTELPLTTTGKIRRNVLRQKHADDHGTP